MWRNLGIVLALWFTFITLLCISIERSPAAGSNQAILLYQRGGGGKFIRASAQSGNAPKDREEGQGDKVTRSKPGESGEQGSSQHVAAVNM
jgi:hypothetical protein